MNLNFASRVGLVASVSAMLMGCAATPIAIPAAIPEEVQATITTRAPRIRPRNYGEWELSFLSKIRQYIEGDLTDFAKFEELFGVKVKMGQRSKLDPPDSAPSAHVWKAPMPFSQRSTPASWELHHDRKIGLQISPYHDGVVWTNGHPDPDTVFCIFPNYFAQAFSTLGWSDLGVKQFKDISGNVMYATVAGYRYVNTALNSEVGINVPISGDKCIGFIQINSRPLTTKTEE